GVGQGDGQLEQERERDAQDQVGALERGGGPDVGPGEDHPHRQDVVDERRVRRHHPDEPRCSPGEDLRGYDLRHPSSLPPGTRAYPEVNWCPTTSPPLIATISPRNPPSPYSLPGLNAQVRENRTDPRDSWMWPCRPTTGW